MKKKQRAFKIGFGTVLIVVAFVTALESALQSVPLVFLKVAEDQVGEADLMMLPTKTIISNPDNLLVKDEFSLLSTTMVNHTEIEEKVKTVDFIKGASPRWIFIGKIRKLDNPEENTTLSILFANTSKEVNIGLGREFTKKTLKENQVIITRAALRSLGMDDMSNPTLEFYINIADFFNTFFKESKDTFTTSNNLMDLQLKPALKKSLILFTKLDYR